MASSCCSVSAIESRPFRRQWRTNGSISNAKDLPDASVTVWLSRSTVTSRPERADSMSSFTWAWGRVIGTSPICTEFEKKMSPNEGAITTSKP